MIQDKTKLIQALKNSFGDINKPDDQEIDSSQFDSFGLGLFEALNDAELGNEVSFEEMEVYEDWQWHNSYYSKVIEKTIVLNCDDPSECQTIEELADFIIEANQEAYELENKLRTFLPFD